MVSDTQTHGLEMVGVCKSVTYSLVNMCEGTAALITLPLFSLLHSPVEL